MAGTDLSRLEQDLLRVPGVRSARVVGVDVPSEIHIVTTAKRSPKQVVRDVQSLAAAGFGIPIDHRIVSVVQLDEPPGPPPPNDASARSPVGEERSAAQRPRRDDARSTSVSSAEQGRSNGPHQVAAPVPEPSIETSVAVSSNGHRLVLERVVLASKGDAGWVKVALRWPDGRMSEGAGTAGAERDTRARGAATAALQALAPGLDAANARLDVDHVMIQRIGTSDSVVVRALFYEAGNVTPLVCSAIVHDDVATAAVRAILQAVNRKLRLASERS